MIRDRTEARTEKKKRPSDRLNILLFFQRPEENAARLSSSLNWESDTEEVSYLLLVDYDFPPEL